MIFLKESDFFYRSSNKFHSALIQLMKVISIIFFFDFFQNRIDLFARNGPGFCHFLQLTRNKSPPPGRLHPMSKLNLLLVYHSKVITPQAPFKLFLSFYCVIMTKLTLPFRASNQVPCYSRNILFTLKRGNLLDNFSDRSTNEEQTNRE